MLSVLSVRVPICRINPRKEDWSDVFPSLDMNLKVRVEENSNLHLGQYYCQAVEPDRSHLEHQTGPER